MPGRVELQADLPSVLAVAGQERATTLRLAWAAATALFILALPVALVLGAVRFAFSWQPVYTYAVTAYHADETTGISQGRLLVATATLRNYFTNGQRDLDTAVVDGSGRFVPLFNDREIAHMRDVKSLVRRMYVVLDVALAYLLLYVVAAATSRDEPVRRLARAVLSGAGLACGLLLGFGALVALGGFEQIFISFHQFSFSNDFWQLDPSTDRLVQIFPQGFWLDVSAFVGLVTLIAALALAAIAGTALFLHRPRRSGFGE